MPVLAAALRLHSVTGRPLYVDYSKDLGSILGNDARGPHPVDVDDSVLEC